MPFKVYTHTTTSKFFCHSFPERRKADFASGKCGKKKVSTVSNDSEFEHLIVSTDMTSLSTAPRRGEITLIAEWATTLSPLFGWQAVAAGV